MRPALVITFFCFSSLSFGQDSLQIDSIFKTSQSNNLDGTVEDSFSSALKHINVKRKKQRKNVKRPISNSKPDAGNIQDVDVTNVGRFRKGQVIFGILLIAIVLGFVISRLIFRANIRHHITNIKNKGLLSDYLARLSLSRRVLPLNK